MIDQELLSNVQLEALIYICQKHEQISPDGYRYGFLLGDGAGIGKGREIASVIYENWCLYRLFSLLSHSSSGRKKALWISESPDLYYDACRDMSDLQADIPVSIRHWHETILFFNIDHQFETGTFGKVLCEL